MLETFSCAFSKIYLSYFICTLSVLWSFGSFGYAIGEPNTTPPNIVLILAEDFGFGDPACYGHPYSRTPNIDKLAKEGTQFMNFHVTGTTCAPSRAGFMTSRHPASFPNYMPDWTFQGVPTVTDHLKARGYTTGHIGKWHMGHDERPPKGTYGIDYINIVGPSNGHPEGKDFDVFAESIDFIQSNSENGPFYLNVWTHIAHSPVDPHESLVAEFSDVVVDRNKFGRHMQSIFDLSLDYGGNLNNSMRHYLADVWSLDLQIGKLMQKLDDLGLRDNTVFVFTADQGAAPPLDGQSNPQYMLGYAGGLRGGKHGFYEGGVRTSFIVRWPGQVPAGKINVFSHISGLDWLPTLCSIAGVTIEGAMYEGEDVLDIWKGDDRSRINPIFYKTSNVNGPKAILYGKWKFHSNKDLGKALFDLETNPEEDINLINLYPGIAAVIENQLKLWDSTLPSEYCLKKYGCKAMLPFDPNKLPEIVGPPLFFGISRDPTEKPSEDTTARFPITAQAEAPTLQPIAIRYPSATGNPANIPSSASSVSPAYDVTLYPSDALTSEPFVHRNALPSNRLTTYPTTQPGKQLPYPTSLPQVSLSAPQPESGATYGVVGTILVIFQTWCAAFAISYLNLVL